VPASGAERIEAALLTDRVGVTQAPDMSDSDRALLKEVRQVLTEQLQRRGVNMRDRRGPRGRAESDGTERQSGAATGQRLVVGEIASREDVIRTLDKICEYYNRHEPSSPVPFC
jgi:type VI secretion system protein ImpA